MKATMNQYIQHLDTHEGTDDELRGDHVLADLADALSKHEGQYIKVMNAIQAEMGLLHTSASDEKKLKLKRRQRKSKLMKIKKLEVQPTTLFGYDDGPDKEAELARQKKRANAMKALEDEKKRQEEERLKEEQAKEHAKEQAKRVAEQLRLDQISDAQKELAEMAKVNDPAELALAIDAMSTAPPHVMQVVATELQRQKERLVELKANLSAAAAEQLLNERVAAAKEELQAHMATAGENVDDLTRYLNSLQWEDNGDIVGPMQDMIDQAEQLLRDIQTHHNTCVEELNAAVTTQGDDQLKRLATALRNFENAQPAITDLDALGLHDRGERLLVRLKELVKLKQLLMKLNQKAIAEIKSMAAPLQDIQDIVATMLILLGSNRKDCSSWKAMRSAIGKTGKESLRRKIMTFDIGNVTKEMAERAHLLMAKVELDRAVEVSPTAAIFYAFSRGTLSMMAGSEEELKIQEQEALTRVALEKEKADADAQIALLMQQGAERRKGTKRMKNT